MSALRASLVLLALFLAVPAVAGADAWRPVTTSCVRSAASPGCDAVANATGLWNLQVGPGGTTAYATAWNASTLLVFDRDRATGRLTSRGCFREGGGNGCGTARGLGFFASADVAGPDGIAISADGRSLYVASWQGSVAVFRRDATTGNLTFANCLSTNGSSNGVANQCAPTKGLFGARDVLISADQQTLHVGPAGSIATFKRLANGDLEQLAGTAGCVTENATAGCLEVNGLGFEGRQMALSADGQSLYAGDSSLAILKRAPNGALGQDPGTSSCFTRAADPNCTTDARLSGTDSFLVGPGDRQLYATTDNGVLVWGRGASGQLTFQSCINDAGNGCGASGKALQNLSYFAISPDGEDLVANISTLNPQAGIVTLSRDAAGNLSQRAGTTDVCVSRNGSAIDGGVAVGGACIANAAMAGNGRIAFSGDGVFHAGGFLDNVIVTFKRDFPPVCPSQNLSTPRDTSVVVGFGCSDRNGDPLSYEIAAAPLAGTLGGIDQAGGRVFYNPFGGFVGADGFKFRAVTATQKSADTTIAIDVQAPPGGGVVVPSGLDGDGDGFFAGQDCNDANKAIRPGAVEIKGNRIDENCDGVAEPFPTLTSGVVHNWSFKRTSPAFTLKVLQITQQFPKGWKAEIKCSGKKCPFKTKALKAGKVKRNASTVLGSLSAKQRKFRAGQTVEVWVGAPNFNTKVARIPLKQGKQPVIRALCVVPGQTKPQKSCS